VEENPKAEGHIVISGRVYPANKVINALIREGFADVKIEAGGVLVIGGERIQPLFQSVQDRAMAITCYGSLAYCCGLEKKCPIRDEALRLLGLSEADYLKIKRYMHNKFIEYAKGLWGIREENIEKTYLTDENGYLGKYRYERKERWKEQENEYTPEIGGFCVFCGEKLPLNARYCKRCGRAVQL